MLSTLSISATQRKYYKNRKHVIVQSSMTVELKRHLHCLLFFAQILLKTIHLETSHRVKLKMLAFHLHYTGPCYATCVFFSIFSNLE